MRGSCLLMTCSTRFFRLSLNLFTLIMSISSPSRTETPYNYSAIALTRPSTATAFTLLLRLHYKAARVGRVSKMPIGTHSARLVP
ncbi:hypothetical protein C7H08_04225 [Marinobacter halophilus]|uniref:Uncharacterized protein n=1 Tax=Marinobacter halophilus TaxID=1323740 RepID=A0A2T1KI70_9GAMM|nr:hypothetical protein C7H08_04225 [Marinobacter halophilus]